MLDWARTPDRLPPLRPEDFTEAQRAAEQRILEGPRRQLSAPFQVLIRMPELMETIQEVGASLRYRGALPDRLRELAILVTAAQWRQPVEWAIHAPIARDTGLSEEAISVIAAGSWPDRMAKDEAIVYDFCLEAHRDRHVADETWGRAIELFGDAGTIELATLCGYYAMLALVMNIAQTEPPGVSPQN